MTWLGIISLIYHPLCSCRSLRVLIFIWHETTTSKLFSPSHSKFWFVKNFTFGRRIIKAKTREDSVLSFPYFILILFLSSTAPTYWESRCCPTHHSTCHSWYVRVIYLRLFIMATTDPSLNFQEASFPSYRSIRANHCHVLQVLERILISRSWIVNSEVFSPK